MMKKYGGGGGGLGSNYILYEDRWCVGLDEYLWWW
jgi:hypothetical protein